MTTLHRLACGCLRETMCGVHVIRGRVPRETIEGLRVVKPCTQHRVQWIENEWLVPIAPLDDVTAQLTLLTLEQKRELQGIVLSHHKVGRLRDIPLPTWRDI